MFMIGLGISGTVSLDIGRAILIGIDIATSFFRLFLWFVMISLQKY